MSTLIIPTERADVFLSCPEPGEPFGDLRTEIFDAGTAVGTMELYPSSPEAARVGYRLASDHRKNGYATVALRAMTDYAFDELGFRVLEASILPGNTRSEAVARRAGYELLSSHGGRLIYSRRPSVTEELPDRPIPQPA